MKRTLAVLAVIVFAGCSGAGTLPARHASGVTRGVTDSAQGSPGESAQGLPGESAQGLPGESAQGLPGESAQGLPGESAQGLPGESAQGLPGGTFSCPGLPATGSASCTMIVNTTIAPTPNVGQTSTAIAGLKPSDLQAAYGLPSDQPGGTVAIVGAFDSPSAEADLAVYRAAFGLPACTSANGCFRKVNQRGQTGSYPAVDTGWAQETALDLDMVSAACPRCSIVLVEADSAAIDDLGASVDTAVTFGPRAVSNSYYALEWANEKSEDVHYRHPGVAITVSSGDRGYASYPAASALVTAVGGTTLSRQGGGWSETGWKYTGHGCSRYVARPWFQQRLNCKTRSTVDVAAVADPQTGVATFSLAGGGWYVAGGTSVGAPLIAGAYALGRPDGPAYSYSRWTTFHQIDGGGYRPLTGIGSPNGVAGL